MPRLKDRNRQIPNGLCFFQPETGWKKQNFPSFMTLVNDLIAHRLGRPDLVQKLGWRTDVEGVSNEVDTFNATICQRMGWNDYFVDGGGAAAPFNQAPPPSLLSKLAAVAGQVSKLKSGYAAIREWKVSNDPAVSPEQSEARAAVCATCPLNQQGDFTRWFTVPASEAMRKDIEELQGRSLKTVHDDKLNICSACFCPMKLKVHVPFQFIKPTLTPEVVAKLEQNPACWITDEFAAYNEPE